MYAYTFAMVHSAWRMVPKIPEVAPLFLGWKNIEVGFQTKVCHMAALALVFQSGIRSRRLFEEGKETGQRPIPVNATVNWTMARYNFHRAHLKRGGT